MAKLVSPKRVPTKLADFSAAEHEIYKLYPRRKDHKFIGLQKIRWAIGDLGGDRDVAATLLKARVVAFAAQVKRVGVEDEFVPMCKTWMGGRRYLDDPEPEPSLYARTEHEHCEGCGKFIPCSMAVSVYRDCAWWCPGCVPKE